MGEIVEVPTEEEVDLFFKLHDKIKAHTRAVSEICTGICDCEEIEYITDDNDGYITIGVYSRDCGRDSYGFPKDYLSMPVDAIIRRIEDEKRRERERRKIAVAKAKAKREANRAKREAAKEAKERAEYERLKAKFEVEDRTYEQGRMMSEGRILDK